MEPKEGLAICNKSGLVISVMESNRCSLPYVYFITPTASRDCIACQARFNPPNFETFTRPVLKLLSPAGSSIHDYQRVTPNFPEENQKLS